MARKKNSTTAEEALPTPTPEPTPEPTPTTDGGGEPRYRLVRKASIVFKLPSGTKIVRYQDVISAFQYSLLSERQQSFFEEVEASSTDVGSDA